MGQGAGPHQMSATSKDRLVPFSSKFAYGVGQFAEGLKNTAFVVFVLFYYNQVLGLPGTMAGAALFVALLFDAVTDPLAGSLSDNHRSRLGRRHPFMYASALPLGLAFTGLFWPPEGLSEWGLCAWLTAFATLTRAAMTLYHVPHLAMGAEMTENFSERTRIVAFRQFFGTAGFAAASLIGLGWFFADERGGRLAAENYGPYAIILAVLMVATVWYSAFGTRAESELYRSWGASLVGMTALPEAKLAREAELCYAMLAAVTDYDAWHAEEATVDAAVVFETLAANVETGQRAVARLAAALNSDKSECGDCERALDAGLVTPPRAIGEAARERLAPILRRRLEAEDA